MDLKQEVPIPELDLWGKPLIQRSIIQDITVNHRSTDAIDMTKPLKFDFTIGEDEYMLFSESYLKLKIEPTLLKADKTAATTAAEATSFIPENNLFHSMIDSVSLTFGSTSSVHEIKNYAYKAYFETMLGYSADARESHLSSALWEETDSERATRIKGANGGKTFELKSKLHVDFTHQNRAIIGGTRVKIEITFQKHASFFMRYDTGLSVKFELLDAVLECHLMQVAPKIVSAHQKALAIAPARYPMTIGVVYTESIPRDATNFYLQKAITGQTPRKIYVALVTTKAFNGSREKSPFTFTHQNLQKIICYRDGISIPRNGYEMNYTEDLYSDAYIGFIQTLNQNNTDSYAEIDYGEYKTKKCIYGFNLQPDLSNGTGIVGYISDTSESIVRFDLTFASPTSENLTALMFAEFDTIMEITANRNLFKPIKQ